MKNTFYTILLGLLLSSCGTKITSNDLANSNPIETKIDLTGVVDDKVPVMINPGRFTQDSAIYRLPKIVQGTYAVSDFGKYVDDFKAFDYNGNEMVFNKTDDNTWVITNASDLDRITYWVNDTYDIESIGGIGGEQPFSPSGTNIEADNFMLNLHGFIGYFESLQNAQYSLRIDSPASFERTSALPTITEALSEDGTITTSRYFAPRYFDITDNPMMFGKLDVEEFMVGDIKIVLSVYSPNQVHKASTIKETVFKMMEAQKNYLGDLNSTPRYDIYLYLSDLGKEDAPKGFGALEHHTSTVVVLPEQSTASGLAKSMTDVVAHEFFHIVTPLSVHSEDVHYFDYHAPTFSKHLWLYEGVTEYFAQHFQVYEGLVTPKQFYNEILSKIESSMRYRDTMSFTTMSENILDEPYASNYINVYSKGALIGMCIDILMREKSEGTRSLLSLMKELSMRYGKDKPFMDDDLINEITTITYPEIGEFLNTHVVGNTPIDYELFFNKVGIQKAKGKVETNYLQNAGNPILAGNSINNTIFFSGLVKDNSFWNEQGVRPGDILKSIDGVLLSVDNADEVLSSVFGWELGQTIEVVIQRLGEEITIKTEATQSYYTGGEMLAENPDATAAQITLRNAWLNN